MRQSVIVTALVAVTVGGAAGYWLGSRSATDPAAAAAGYTATAPAPSASARGGGGYELTWSSRNGKPATPAATQSVAAVQGEPGEAVESVDVVEAARLQALASVDELAMALAGDPRSPETQQQIDNLKQGLLDKASADSRALAGLIAAFEADPNSELGRHIGSVLSELRDPEVESMAQDMVRSGSPERMKTGLEILGALGIPNEETLALTQQIIRQPYSDPDLLMGAIHAMPVMAVPPQQAAETISTLAHLASSHPSEGVRSNSLFKLAEWAKDGTDLQPVMQALDKSRSPDDRISAAMALAQSTVVDDQLRAAMLARISDKDELWEVRRYAAETLERFKLSSSEYRVLEAFRHEQIDVQNSG